MSVNRELPHVFVLPEDGANRELANGFHLQIDWNRQRQLQILPEAGGWIEVLDQFESVHIRELDRWLQRLMVLLIDFDGRESRLGDAMTRVPVHLVERVFVLGAFSEPEDLKRTLGSYESIGSAMAEDCRNGTEATWGHDLLRHNVIELRRLNERARPVLFPVTQGIAEH